jgi:hypothetical protein
MSDIWEDVKKEIRGTLPEKTFSLWISPISLVERKEDVLVLGCLKFSIIDPRKLHAHDPREPYSKGKGHCSLTFKVKGLESRPPPSTCGPQQLAFPYASRKI